MTDFNTFLVPSDDLYITPNLQPGQLPEQLERAISVTDIPSQQDMILLGALSMISYATPRMRILHGNPQHAYYPNLMTLVVAPPAAGKGILNYTKKLVQPIHDELLRHMSAAFIPANSSSAAFIDLLAHNGGQGVMFETEMDVLSQVWKHDYGQYSHMLRQVFEHETVSRSRKGRDGEVLYVEVPEPRLSVLLSGTLNQLKPLLGNRDNGLASRFMPYLVQDVVPVDPRAFSHGDKQQENSAQTLFRELGQDILRRWKWLSSQQQDITWSFTDEQAAIIADLFDDGYRLAFEGMQLPISFDPAYKRMAVTIKRIGTVLSLLRLPLSSSACEMNPGETVPPTSSPILYCSDEDFQTLVLLAEKLLRHAALMTLLLPEEEQMLETQIVSETQDRAELLLESLGEKFTTQDAVAKGEELGMKKRSVERYLTSLREQKRIVREKNGEYLRV
ncbi:MAG: DUF3987 domain-containing protein [Bacteroidales bacterium]|nr:DUF3987 domain-containing protein [Bacteroidales bacterium]